MRITKAFASCLLLAIAAAGCASPLQRPAVTTPAPLATPETMHAAALPRTSARPIVGVAFGGGSARGLAHVGVIRWFEEHRIPIDLAAGTSMGGLVGGAFSTGMDAAELEAMILGLDWDQMFGASSFAFKNIRRKTDARAFPSRLEFGLKGGIVAPTALNSGEQVDRLLRRLTAAYGSVEDFDDLPTPFRAVAVDLLSAKQVVLERGSLAQAMRATMSIPLVFPPVALDGRVLVDGGALNNVPSDVVRAMGADRVVAINVGDLADREGVSYTLLGLTGATIDAMMRASTKASIAAADVIIDVPLEDFGSLDWRRSRDLIAAGYAAAEAHRDALLPLALDEAAYRAWRDERDRRRRRTIETPSALVTEGFAASDARRLKQLLDPHVGRPLDVPALEKDLDQLSGLDRYETVTWHIDHDAASSNRRSSPSLVITARPKAYAPPFLMLGLNVENTTSRDFRITTTARYLAYDLISSGSELRVDGTLGSSPAAGVELYTPLGATPLFVAPFAQIVTDTATSLAGDQILARYEIKSSRLGLDAGVNLGRHSDLRVGAFVGRVTANLEVGDPRLPELRGKETGAHVTWRYDGQDSPVIPSHGLRVVARLQRFFDGPNVTSGDQSFDVDARSTQAIGTASQFWSLGARNRLFAAGGLGTSFRHQAQPTNQFTLGTPLSLGAYRTGELRGSHYYVASAGLLRQMARLPDFLGGPVFVGAWLENGDAFDDWTQATWRTNASTGVILDTLVGPVIVAGSAGFDGRWRTYVGVGRIFR